MTETETGPSIDTALGDLALLPGATRVLEDHALDFCCRGGRSLREACAERGIDAPAVLEQLRAGRSGPAPDWTTLDAGGLVDHVLEHHHAYLRDELPRLEALAHKVRSVHGARHPELIEVEALVRDLRHDLEPHLDKEERVLFPAIAAAADGTGGPLPLDGPVAAMTAEHETAGDLLATLREVTGGYAVPDDACASYRDLYARLSRLEEDTHLHIHKENHRLFPMALALVAR